MSTGISKDKLIYDTSESAENDNMGAFLKDSSGALLTGTTIGASRALDVNLVGSSGQGIFLEDSAHVSGDAGQQMLAVRKDVEGSLVSADGDYASLQVDALGRLRVAADISVVTGHEKIEDDAHASADVGSFVLGVRQDTLVASVSADGDYAAFKMDSVGRLWSNSFISGLDSSVVFPVAGNVADDAVDSGNPVKIGSRAVSGALAAVSAAGDRADAISDLYRRLYVNTTPNIAMATASTAMSSVAAVIVTSALAGRRNMLIKNESTKVVHVGIIGVTTANGFPIAAGATMSLDIGPNIAIYGIMAAAATGTVRVLELA